MRKHYTFVTLTVIYLIVVVSIQFITLPKTEIMPINGVAIIDSTIPKPVIKVLHYKDNKDVGVIEESVNRYQFAKGKNKVNYTTIEIELTNPTNLVRTYDIFETKLILENGKELKPIIEKSSDFDLEMGTNFTQIGNLVFNNGNKELKAIKFPDGSVYGL